MLTVIIIISRSCRCRCLRDLNLIDLLRQQFDPRQNLFALRLATDQQCHCLAKTLRELVRVPTTLGSAHRSLHVRSWQVRRQRQHVSIRARVVSTCCCGGC